MSSCSRVLIVVVVGEDMEEVVQGVEMEVLVMLLLRSGDADEVGDDGRNRFGV